MLQAAVFHQFKGADTLLLWGDADGMSELRHAIVNLGRGEVPTIEIGDLSISTSNSNTRRSELSRSSGGLSWVCLKAVLTEAEALLTGLDEVPSGHQFIDVAGLADQVFIAKNEYPETLRP